MTACRRQDCICFRYADIQTQRRTCTHSHTPAFICQMATCGASYCSSCHLSHSSPRGISLPQKTHLSSLSLSLCLSLTHTHLPVLHSPPLLLFLSPTEHKGQHSTMQHLLLPDLLCLKYELFKASAENKNKCTFTYLGPTSKKTAGCHKVL